jgi:hypothetical protein
MAINGVCFLWQRKPWQGAAVHGHNRCEVQCFNTLGIVRGTRGTGI